MSHLWGLYAIARADFFERTRRYQYLATIALTVFTGTLLLPSKSAGYSTFLIDGYRGIYNSAWIGVAIAALAALLLSLFGFYNVKSAVQRDRETHVGEIIASTSVGKLEYTLGKFFSNFAVLGSMLLVFFLVAVAMQLVRGESYALNAGQIVLSLLLIVAPVIAVVSALAVLFEMIPWLRGGLGNVVYFFLWIFFLTTSAQPTMQRLGWWTDLLGLNAITRQIFLAVTAVDPHANINSLEMGDTNEGTKYFTFNGLHWSAGDITDRLMWFAVALLLAAAASIVFDRFASGARAAAAREPKAFTIAWRSRVDRLLTPLVDLLCASDFGAIVLAELRLLLNGLGFWWYAVAAGLFIAGLVTKGNGQNVVLGLAWLWPMLQLSQLGTREAIYETEQFIYPTLHPIRRQFVAQWVAGIAVMVLAGGGSLLHFIATGNALGIEGVIVGAVFVPTLALACGALSGTTRLFEILYLILWYMGPMNHTFFDYTQGANAAGFAIAAVVLSVVALASRRMRLAQA